VHALAVAVQKCKASTTTHWPYKSCTLPVSVLSTTQFILSTMPPPQKTLDDFLEEVQCQFKQQLKIESLLVLSKQLQLELRQHLHASPQCMLPSYNYTLPTGNERGEYLALEVGGSNLRMALVELGGRSLGPKSMQIRRTVSFPIDNTVRQLPQYAFFDWMAERIGDMLRLQSGSKDHMEGSGTLRMGIAWSFPIESVMDSTTNGYGNMLTSAVKDQ
jgi:hexokinase